MVMLMSVIILVAVGADHNPLLVSRFKEGLKTGMIRAMGGTGKIVTWRVWFAFTMASMIVSDLLVVGQVGSTIGGAVRHPGRAVVHDAVGNRVMLAAGSVAAERAHPPSRAKHRAGSVGRVVDAGPVDGRRTRSTSPPKTVMLRRPSHSIYRRTSLPVSRWISEPSVSGIGRTGQR